ncbi:glycosyl hydrolase [Flavobacterium aquicola]|uniref:Putative secreted protein (Por secretion system target) n=1 Tax=Flavobacterium aquicola TaxID=1682742 RepID=A0A3E0E778_9FLAO|nr:glycosyl hydrolase [Flavobacterium aquicola]REG94091.1 putative secreted protein (Por secretion system target) [Flavobacterium aquicola]
MPKIILSIILLIASLYYNNCHAQVSPKRGVAYGKHSTADLNALKSGISWWYNWSPVPESTVDANYESFGVEFVAMAWGKINNPDAFIATIKPGAKYLLAFNEPNFNDGAKLTPQEAVNAWPNIEKIATAKGLEIVSASPAFNGPSNYGGYSSPIAWHDEFFRLCPTCKVDYIAFHTYDATAGDIVGVTSLLKKYNIPIWVTEFANRVVQSAADKTNFMKQTVTSFENDPDIYRYSWFTCRVPSNWTDMLEGQLLGPASGAIRPIGTEYLNVPYTTKKMNVPGRITANKHYRRKGTSLQSTTDGGTSQNVCFADSGDWGEYMINVAKNGSYQLTFRVASLNKGMFDISVNDVIVKTDETFEATGGLQIYTDKIVTGISLPQGENYIKIHYKSKFNFNYIDAVDESTLGIPDKISEKNTVLFYPNPFTSDTKIQIKSPVTEPIQLKIVDMKGITCFSSNDFYTNQNITIDNHLATGVYTAIVTYGTTKKTFRIIKD